MENDIEIINKIINGNSDYFPLLIDKYHNEIFSFVYNIIGDYQKTEDILQEVFLKTYNNLGKYNSSKASFRTWLYRITNNHTMNYVKSKYYKTTLRENNNININMLSSSSNENDILKHEKIQLIVNAIEKLLKPKHKRIMYLYYFSGLSVKEINKTTAIPEKTIYNAINSSIEKIKKEVIDYE